MNQEGNDDLRLRKYLLGELNEAEQETLEQRLLTESELFALLPVIEDELIDEYLSEALEADERGNFESYFLLAPERRRKLSFAMSLRRYIATEEAAAAAESAEAKPSPQKSVTPPPSVGQVTWWNRALSSPYFRMAAAAVIVVGLGLGMWRLVQRHPQMSGGMAALREAYKVQRPIEARISDWNYAPPPPITRGTEEEKFDYVTRDRAEALLHLEFADSHDAQSYREMGQLYLAKRDFVHALEQFEKAMELGGESAQLHSDIGAALLEQGKAERKSGDSKSPETFGQSLSHLNKALELDPGLLEALFNRALCKQEIKLFEQAETDWLTYLEKDQNSKWAEEARLKLKEIQERKQKTTANKERLLEEFLAAYEVRDDERAWAAFSQGRFRAGNIVTGKLIDSYLRSSMERAAYVAQSEIEKVVYAGALEAEKVGDRYTADLAQFYASANLVARRELLDARSLMQAADERSRAGEYEQAMNLYSKARRLFERNGDACESVFSKMCVGIVNLRTAPKESLRILEPLAPMLDEKGYKYLLAMCLNGMADAHFSLRELSQSLELGDRALQTSEHIRDINGVLRNLQLPVAMQLEVGEYNNSLASIFRALDIAATSSPDPKEVWAYYQQAALNYYWLGEYKTALDFQNEAFRLAAEAGLGLYKSRSYSQAGLIYEKLNDYDAAIRNVELALGEGQKLADQKSGFNLVANSTLSLAHLYRDRGDLRQALVYYDQAIQLHDRLNIEIYSFQAHKGKLTSLIGLNDDSAAEREMKTAIRMIEEYRPRISEETSRNAFFDLAQSVYDIAIDFSYSRLRDKQTAFDYAEASHARTLLDLIKSSSKVVDDGGRRDIRLSTATSPLNVSQIQERLPPEVQIVVYSVLDKRVLIWVISRTGFEGKEREIALDDLTGRVRVFVTEVEDPQSKYQDVTRRARELYELLIEPIEPLLNDNGYLCIVPDKVLNYLPFCALISPRTGKYFVEERSFGLAPSSTIFLACSDEALSKGKKSRERLLIVADPTLDLASTEKQAREASGFYRKFALLIGAEATKSRVKNEMSRADVIEFASHYVPEAGSPLRSKLLLAKGTASESRSDDGDLEASEVYDMKLPLARLVVLSACETGVELAYRGEGAISLARAFIKAGVPIVIASLWPVDSKATAELMISFHKHRAQEGVSTAEALSRAQKDMIEKPNERNQHPYYWAGFTVVGGYATF